MRAELELTDQLVAADALQEVSRRADAQCLKQILLVVVDRQHHDLALRVALAQLKAQVQAAGTLHAHVAQHDVGVELVDHAVRPLSADGLADHLDAVGEGGEHGFEAFNDHLVVVDQHKTHRRAAGRHFTTLELAFSWGRGTWPDRSPNWGRTDACDVGHANRHAYNAAENVAGGSVLVGRQRIDPKRRVSAARGDLRP